MSKSYGIEEDNPDELVFYEDDFKAPKTKPKKKYKRSRDIVFNDYTEDGAEQQEERTIFIKEFDLNSMPPQSVSDKSGVKIVIIGKPGCFKPGTEVLMYDGSVKRVEDVKIGDVLMGDDGSTGRTVQSLYHDWDEMYEIVPNKGTPYTVNRLHDLVLMSSRNQYGCKKGDTIEISVADYLTKSEGWKSNFRVFRCAGITCWKDNNLEIDPYFLGVWLGDGTSANLNITNIDHEILDYCEEYVTSLGLCWNKSETAKYRYSITSESGTKNKNTLLNSFNKLNLIDNKHIPQCYKISSENTRLNLLAGLIDTDGSYDKKGKGYDFIQKNEKLVDDIIFVARSLGFTAIKKQCKKSCMYKGEKREGTYFRVFIYGNDIDKIPVKIERKRTQTNSRVKNSLVSGFEVIPKGHGEYFGFSLDGNRRFCLTSFEVARNTGKSTVIQDIIASKAHMIPAAQIFSGTEDSNHFYSEKFPGVCVYNKLDEKAVENFVTRQKAAMKYLENPWAMQIIDDCTDDPKILTKPLFQSYYKNGRHWKMIHILSLQYCLDIRPNIRTNIDYTFILRETNLKNRKSLHENYAGCIDNFQDFCDVMDQITEDYTALVINNRVQSNKIEDCVFWYKANPNRLPPNWKFGHPSAWDFHLERFNPTYQDGV